LLPRIFYSCQGYTWRLIPPATTIISTNEVGNTLKLPETINGNVKNLSKRMKMKDEGKIKGNVKDENER
jgi:hypothetical protein